jgi:predicted RNA-binding Zn-ribbon protein involved in translation (DUF1610 family)
MKIKITSKEYSDTEEEYAAIFKCPNCKQEAIHQHDKYCCECGAKIEWDETAKEYFV